MSEMGGGGEARVEIDLSTEAGVKHLADLVAAAVQAQQAEEELGRKGRKAGKEVADGAKEGADQLKTLGDVVNRIFGAERVQVLRGIADGFKEISGAAKSFVSDLDSKTSGVAQHAKMIERLGFAYGMTADKLQAVARVQDMAGGGGLVGFDQMSRGIGLRMERYLSMQEGGSESGGRFGMFFKQLGVQLQEPNGQRRSAPAVTTDILDKLTKVTDQSRALNLAETMLGDSGRTLVLIARQRGQTYSEMVRGMEKYNVLTPAQVRATAELTKATAELSRRQKALDELFAASTAPALIAIKTQWAEITTEIVKNHDSLAFLAEVGKMSVGPLSSATSGLFQLVWGLKAMGVELKTVFTSANLVKGALAGIAGLGILGFLAELARRWGEVAGAQQQAARESDNYKASLAKLKAAGQITPQQYEQAAGPPEPTRMDRVRAARNRLAARIGKLAPAEQATIDKVDTYDRWQADPNKGVVGPIKPAMPAPRLTPQPSGDAARDLKSARETLAAERAALAKFDKQPVGSNPTAVAANRKELLDRIESAKAGLSTAEKAKREEDQQKAETARQKAAEAVAAELAKAKADLAEHEARRGATAATAPASYSNGQRLAGMGILGVLSNAAVHKGTHNEPGTFDIGGNEILRHARETGASIAEIQRGLADRGLVVAWRDKDQGMPFHFHIADPRLSPKEAARLRSQTKRIADGTNQAARGDQLRARVRGLEERLATLGGPAEQAQLREQRAQESVKSRAAETEEWIAKLEAAIGAKGDTQTALLGRLGMTKPEVEAEVKRAKGVQAARQGGAAAWTEESRQSQEAVEAQRRAFDDLQAKLEAALEAGPSYQQEALQRAGARTPAHARYLLRDLKQKRADAEGEGAGMAERSRQSREEYDETLKQFDVEAQIAQARGRMADTGRAARDAKKDELAVEQRRLQYLRESHAAELDILKAVERVKVLKGEMADAGRLKYDVLAASAGGDAGLEAFMRARGSGGGYLRVRDVPGLEEQGKPDPAEGTYHPLGRADLAAAAAQGVGDGFDKAAPAVKRAIADVVDQKLGQLAAGMAVGGGI